MHYRTDLAYLYDGSFEGVLCCFFESYVQKELPSIIFDYGQAQETLFPVKEIVTDPACAKKVELSITRRISQEAMELVRMCYYSNMEGREVAILNFLRLGYKAGRSITNMLSNDVVRTVTNSARFVSRESAYFMEFLRFSEYNDVLVAIIEPKNFVLPMIFEHFCDRFPDEQFMIFDKSNKYAFVYRNGAKNLFPLEQLELPEAGSGEEEIRALWKQFYNTISIEGRYNPKLRMNNMPKRYWTHMTEFQ